jgi:hypothetical protein
MAKLPLTNSDKFALIDDWNLPWASQYVWRVDEDGHVVRDVVGEDGRPAVIYLCNEVMSRATGTPLEEYGPPRTAWRARLKRALGLS